MSGIIYFIECAGRIKIGFTRKSISDRIRGLTTGAPDALKVLGSIPGTVYFERAIHRAAKNHRVKGEWFLDCPEIRELMAALVENGPDAIGFIEPITEPSFGPNNPLSSLGSKFSSPLIPFSERICELAELYVGARFKDARSAENELGLPAGTLINRIIGGHFSPERTGFAVSMLKNSMECMDRVVGVVLEDIDWDNPVPHEDFIPFARHIVERLERGLKRLFENPDTSILDVSGYDGMSLRKPERVAA